LGALIAVVGASLAIAALMAGPIGVALLEPFGPSSLSRLTVLQFSVFFGGLGLVSSMVLVACWDNAPRGLHMLFASALLHKLARRFEEGFHPGSGKVFWAVIGVCALWVNIEMLWRLPVVACLEPDTMGYLAPSAFRSAGYMVFLDAVVGVTGDLRWVMPVQLNLMLASFGVLGWSTRKTMGSLAAGMAVALVPMLSAAVLLLAPRVMSEAVFMSLVCLHMAGVVSALRKVSWGNVSVIGLTLALMIVVRPNGISFAVDVAVLMYLSGSHWRRVAVGALVPVIIVVGLQGLYNQAKFGFFGLHKFSGISLVGNYAPLIRGDMKTAYPALAQELDAKLTHYSRDFPPFHERAFPYEMAHVAGLTSAGAIFKVVLPTLREHLGLPEPKAAALQYDPRLNDISQNLALSAIKNDPFGALEIVLSNFIANWHGTLPVRVPMAVYYPRCLKMSRELQAQIPELVNTVTKKDAYDRDSLKREMDQIGTNGLRAIELPRLLISVVQKPLAYIAFALALWGTAWMLFKVRASSLTVRFWGLAGVALHAGYGVISVGNTAFARYTVVFDPVVALMFVAVAIVAVNFLFRPVPDSP